MLEMCRVVRGPVGPVAVFALALFAWAGSVHAQQPSQAQVNAIRQSCRTDYQSYCASVPAGGSAALNCLKENMQSLSGPCQQAVGAVAGAAPDLAVEELGEQDGQEQAAWHGDARVPERVAEALGKILAGEQSCVVAGRREWARVPHVPEDSGIEEAQK